MSRSKINLILLSFSALVLLMLGVWGVHIIRTKNENTSILLSEVNQVADNELRTKSIEQVRESASAEIALFEQSVLTDVGIASAIEKIETAGRLLNVSTDIVSVDKASTDANKNPQELDVVLESIGSWSNNFHFLRAIETLPYKTSLKNVSLTKFGSSWRLNMTVTLYSFK